MASETKNWDELKDEKESEELETELTENKKLEILLKKKEDLRNTLIDVEKQICKAESKKRVRNIWKVLKEILEIAKENPNKKIVFPYERYGFSMYMRESIFRLQEFDSDKSSPQSKPSEIEDQKEKCVVTREHLKDKRDMNPFLHFILNNFKVRGDYIPQLGWPNVCPNSHEIIRKELDKKGKKYDLSFYKSKEDKTIKVPSQMFGEAVLALQLR